jgi:hypothetical protein
MTVGHILIAQDDCGLFLPLFRSGAHSPLTGSRTELGEPAGDEHETLPVRIRCRRDHALIVDQRVADFVARRLLRGAVPVFARSA